MSFLQHPENGQLSLKRVSFSTQILDGLQRDRNPIHLRKRESSLNMRQVLWKWPTVYIQYSDSSFFTSIAICPWQEPFYRPMQRWKCCITTTKLSETLPSVKESFLQKCRDSSSSVSHPRTQPIWTYSLQFLSGCLQHNMEHLSLLMSCAPDATLMSCAPDAPLMSCAPDVLRPRSPAPLMYCAPDVPLMSCAPDVPLMSRAAMTPPMSPLSCRSRIPWIQVFKIIQC